ncbi:DUF2213 domain-containing protein [Curvibacter lanceolatus]|uniref:DUF2213 domain-containing protein n=1 Tax=Curvibacter lanceolatus TaxID=86182 RepID=UPI00035C70DD|nr:DUF2213 domain-containing protein [Curvibacter lanceolatus]
MPPTTDPAQVEAVTAAAPVAAGILYRADTGRVLLLKRGMGGNHPGTWAFPGGGIEEGESPLEAAIRESREETAHTPAAGLELLGTTPDGVFQVFLCAGEPEFFPTLNAEHDGYVWALPDDQPQPLHPGVADWLTASVADDAPGDDQVSGMDEALGVRLQIGDAWAADKASARQMDVNGWFEVKANPISKVGVFPYTGRQIPGAPDPNKIYMVYRPAEELASTETLESLKLIPWIDNHVMLGSEEAGMTPAERKGVQGVTGEDVFFEDGVVRANLKVFSESMANAIDAGKTELSLGYRCRYDPTPGEFEGQAYDYVQRDIRGNHLALVDAGRMGPDVAVLDSADEPKPPTPEEGAAMADENKEGGSGLTLEQALKAIEQVMPALKMLQEHAAGKTADPAPSADTDPNADPDKDPNAQDADQDMPEGKKPDQDKPGTGMDSGMTFKSFAAQAARRDRLAVALSKHIGTFDHAEMTESEVAAYGVKKLGLSVAAGQEAAALAGYLAAAVDPASKAVPTHAQDGAVKKSNFVTRHLGKQE